MVLNDSTERISSHPLAKNLALRFFQQIGQFEEVAAFAQFAAETIASALPAQAVTVVSPDRGNWLTVGASDEKGSWDPTLLGAVLDSDRAELRGHWMAALLDPQSPTREVLIVKTESDKDRPERLRTIDALAALVGAGLNVIRERQLRQRRVRRLEAILQIAAQWNQNLQMESLLTQMAETSTRLFDCERASIFLWDRPNRTLIGRPALGVENNELRIPDDTGIVGQVVHTGEVRRVDETHDQASISRTVDKQLAFHTRSLLCVPLCGKSGKILGAFELINKRRGNFTSEDEIGLVELAEHATVALENSQQYQQLLESRKQIVSQAAARVQLIGQSASIDRLRTTIHRVAGTDLALLVLGENGTGKEIVSQMVHYLSPRRDEPFIAVNCAALTETLLESELFGHEKGAFTDAHEARAGKFELASGGTLFLDEIGDLSLSGQAKLLRVVEEKVVVRVGGSLPIETDARVIAATNQDLAQMVATKKFREDLFYRLNVVTLKVPPLRERVDDIELLAGHFLREFSLRARRSPPHLTGNAVKRLRQHPWPGNVRELRNLMERLAYLTSGDVIDADDLEFILTPRRDATSGYSLDDSLADATHKFQADYIRKQVDAAKGNMSDVARRLGLHRSNLYRKIRQLGIQDIAEEE